MLTLTPVSGKTPSYNVVETTLTDETDYLVIPIGYNPTISVKAAEGATIEVFYTIAAINGADPATLLDDDWIEVTELPTFGADVQLTALKFVATGDVVVRGWIR